MTTYKEKIGTNIEAVSSDPANPVLGQVCIIQQHKL